MELNYPNPSRPGEVSTRLIVAFAIVGVLVAAAVPLGFCLWPHVSKMLWPERLELVFEETFENYREREDRRIILLTINEDPITGEVACSSKKSIKLSGEKTFSSIIGSEGGSFGVILENRYPLIFEFDILITGSPNYAKDPVRACVFYGAKGWVYGSGCTRLCDFLSNGQVRIGEKSVGGFTWKTDAWHHLRLRCSRDKFEAEVDGRKYAKTGQSLLGYETYKGNIEVVFEGRNGTCYFDNIRVYRVVKDE